MARIEKDVIGSMRPDALAGSNGNANGSRSPARRNPYAQEHMARIVERLRDPSLFPDKRRELVHGLNNLRQM